MQNPHEAMITKDNVSVSEEGKLLFVCVWQIKGPITKDRVCCDKEW